MKDFFFKSKKNLLILLLGLGCFGFAQNKTEEINRLLKLSNDAFDKFESNQSLEFAKSALKIAESSGNSEKIAYSQFYIARALEDLGNQTESLKHLHLSENQEFTKNDFLLFAKLRELEGLNYMTLNMFSQSIENFHQAIHSLNKIPNDSLQEAMKSRVFGNLHVVHRDAGNLDSSQFYLQKEIGLLRKMKESFVFSYLSVSYLDFGLYQLEIKNDLDSAQYFIEKSLALLDKYKDPFKQDAYRALGDLNYEKKDYKSSLENYLKSLNIIKELEISDPSYTYVYKRISELYGILGNLEQEKNYLKDYLNLSDSLLISKEQNVGNVINKMMEEERQKQKTFQNRIYWLLLFLFVGFLVKMLLVLRYYKKIKKQKERIINENKLLLKANEEKIELEQKLNDAFEEVIQLAKENSPEFLERFQEVYPHCYNKLIKSYPNLLTGEIRFCAMLYLNFSSKDIAEFTFVTPKAVQNRKNRLRKKLNIPSEEDLNVWMQKFCG